MAPQTPVKSISRKEERTLLKAGLRLFSSGFPNPKRINCPAPATIETLALRSLQMSLPDREKLFDHMTICSPCFNQYHSLVRKKQLHRRLTKLTLYTVLLLSMGAATWWGITRFHSPQGSQVASRQPKHPVSPPVGEGTTTPKPAEGLAYIPMVLDLRNQAVTREPENKHGKASIPTVPRQHFDFSIYLPIGSEEGKYQIRLLNQSSKILSDTKGVARFQDHRVVLMARMDLTQVSIGKYRLAIRQGEWNWAYYSIQVQ
jgi:hypothetical protein